MPGSSMPDVLNALVGPNGIIRTAVGALTPKVQVGYGNPDRNLKGNVLYVEGSAPWDQEWAALGHLRRNEQYTLNLVIQAASNARENDHQAATERCFAIFNAAADALRAKPNLDLTSYDSLTAEAAVNSLVMDFTTGSGRLVRIAAGVRIAARI